jgi:MYXO-CTERM domain-containing protein
MNVGIPDCGGRDAGVGGDDGGPVGYDDGGGMGDRDAGLGRSDGGRGRGAGSGGGCGCSAPGTRSDGPFGAMVGLAFFGLIAWRRRRRGR